MLGAQGAAHLTWNLWSDVRQVLEFHFMVNAIRASSITAVVAGVAGWFMVLRKQTFAGHTLSVVAFPGAAAATWLGISVLWGYFGLCAAAAVVLGLGSSGTGQRSFSSESSLTGVVQAFALACGLLFVMLYKGFLNDTEALLFGTSLGISDHQVIVLAGVAAGALSVIALLGRRLLFASIDPAVAAAQGVPIRAVGLVFIVALGLAVAEASQITGALLVFALLVMPAAAAQQLTARPVLGLALSVVLGLATVWVGEGVSYFSTYPTGFFVTSVGFGVYVLSVGWRAAVEHRGRRARFVAEVVS
jgi:zinc/manganese transport system permease protein